MGENLEKERVAYVNGEVVPESKAKISIGDSGFLYGDAAFDTTRTFGHKIFRLEDHIDRLYQSLKYLRIDPGMSNSKLKDITMKILEANLPLLAITDDYWVTQRFTRGIRGSYNHPTIIVECQPLPFDTRAKFFQDGLPIATPSVRRTPPYSLSPRAKSHNYLNLILGALEVSAQNEDALAVLLDINGNLCEGNGCNIFVVRNGVLSTPKSNYVLDGISRQTTFELANDLGIELREANIDLFDAYTADEIFITSTSWCICHVSKINGSIIGDGTCGPITSRLQKAYSHLVGIDIVNQYVSRLH